MNSFSLSQADKAIQDSINSDTKFCEWCHTWEHVTEAFKIISDSVSETRHLQDVRNTTHLTFSGTARNVLRNGVLEYSGTGSSVTASIEAFRGLAHQFSELSGRVVSFPSCSSAKSRIKRCHSRGQVIPEVHQSAGHRD